MKICMAFLLTRGHNRPVFSQLAPNAFYLACRFGIDFPARQRGESVADIHHGVTAFALPVVDPKAEAFGAGIIPEFGDEAISLVHLPRRFCRETNIGQFCPDVNGSDKKVRFLPHFHPLTPPSSPASF